MTSPWSSTRLTAPRAAGDRCASTATRSAPPPSAPTSPASPPSRASAPPCRASRRGSAATSACARCRTGLHAEMALTYDALFDRVLTRVDPERAHRLGFRAIRAAAPLTRRLSTRTAPNRCPSTPRRPTCRRPPVTAMGLEFPNRLGLAAGFDKNAVGIDALAALGFGFVEIGTVTAQPQPGNPQPRLFRLPAGPRDREPDGLQQRRRRGRGGAARAAVRRGSTVATAASTGRIGQRPTRRPVLGVNIGKTKVVPEDDEQAVLADYAFSARVLAPYADYLVVNVSSPNTPGLRSLQAVDRLAPLLDEVRRVAEEAAGRHVPLCVKIAPDLADDDVVAVAELARSQGLEGIIATNTTISRDGLRTDPAEVEALGAGGLSGPVLRRRSLRGAEDPAGPRLPDRDHLRRRDHHAPTTPAAGSGPGPTSCRPTPGSSTAARCGRAGSWPGSADDRRRSARRSTRRAAPRPGRGARGQDRRRLPSPDPRRPRHRRAIAAGQLPRRLGRRGVAGAPCAVDPPGPRRRRPPRGDRRGRRAARHRHALARGAGAGDAARGHRSARSSVLAAPRGRHAASWSARGTPLPRSWR